MKGVNLPIFDSQIKKGKENTTHYNCIKFSNRISFYLELRIFPTGTTLDSNHSAKWATGNLHAL